MAIHLIIFGLLKLFKPEYLSYFHEFPVQLLNFAVLLSYPINFFIYCRMSRAFRDAFTKLLCPLCSSNNDERVLGTASNVNSKYPQKLTLNEKKSFLSKHSNYENQHDSTVILNANSVNSANKSRPHEHELELTERNKSIDL